jgi:hypothetical protein
LLSKAEEKSDQKLWRQIKLIYLLSRVTRRLEKNRPILGNVAKAQIESQK